MKATRLLLVIILSVLFTSCGHKTAETGSSDIQRQEPTCIEDIIGNSRISVVTGSAQDMRLSAQYPDANLIRLNSNAEMIAAVQTDNADYYYIDSVVAIGADLDKKGIKWYFSDKGPGEKVAAAFRKEDTLLCRQMNEFLSECIENGFLDSLQRKWCGNQGKTAEMPEFEYFPEGKTLAVGLYSNFPFEFVKDGEWTGYEVELMKMFGQHIGANVEVKNYELAGLIPALITNRIDIMVGFMFITEERCKQVLFSIPYTGCRSACFGKDYDSPVAQGEDEKTFVQDLKQRINDNLIVEKRWKLILEGLWETILISIFSILFGTAFGAFVCRLMISKNRFVSGLGSLYSRLVTGIPILVFLMILFYVIFANTSFSGRVISIIAFSMYFGAGTSQIFLTGLRSVDKGQTEAGLAMGFTPLATRLRFVVPQAIHKIATLYKGEVTKLVKDTSIVGYIAVQDLTKICDIIRSRTFDAFFPLIIISILYFILAWLIGRLLDRILKIK